MKRKTTKEKVWNILHVAMCDNLDVRQKTGHIIINGQIIPTPDGYVPNWVFTSISLCGSTCGKRYLRKGKGFLPSDHPEYDFQKKKIGRVWHYRIESLLKPSDPLEIVALQEKTTHPNCGMIKIKPDKEKVSVVCPLCNFFTTVFLKQINKRDVVICRGCKSKLDLGKFKLREKKPTLLIQPKFMSESIITESPPLSNGVEPFEKKLYKRNRMPNYFLGRFTPFKKSKLKIKFARSEL